jgi:flagellar protein FliS
MLYDGALRFMDEAKRALESGDLELQNTKLQKAQKIVTELMGSLDFSAGGEIAQNLLALYTFVLNELVEANIYDDAARIDNAVKTMSELREGWVQVEELSKSSPELVELGRNNAA